MAIVILVMTASCAFGADVQKLLEERTVILYPEGQLLGNMMIGARGRLQFIYVDRALAKAVGDDQSSPDWLKWNTRHWGTDAAKGKTLFIIRYEANKPWDFNAADLAIGGKNIEPGDILTRNAYINEGDLPTGTVGIIAVSVPSEFAAPGKTTVLAYMAYGGTSQEWKVPKK